MAVRDVDPLRQEFGVPRPCGPLLPVGHLRMEDAPGTLSIRGSRKWANKLGRVCVCACVCGVFGGGGRGGGVPQRRDAHDARHKGSTFFLASQKMMAFPPPKIGRSSLPVPLCWNVCIPKKNRHSEGVRNPEGAWHVGGMRGPTR